MHIAWKSINGNGPYAYVQRSVRRGDQVRSEHVAYLGARGPNSSGLDIEPGQSVHFRGRRLAVPPVPRSVARKLRASRSDRQRGIVGYSLRDKRGKRLYTGYTDNPAEREERHRADGRDFAKLRVETGGMTREEARRWERESLYGFRRATGRLPKYN